MNPLSQNLLSIRDLHVHYGKSHVLHGVNLNIAHNEVVSLLGRNGAGRSTTMKAVMGLVPASAGSIQLGGRELTGLRPYRISRAGVGIVPEEREVFANLSVEENLRMGQRAGCRWRHGMERRADVRVLSAFARAAQHRCGQPLRWRTADAYPVPLTVGLPQGVAD